MAVGKDIAWKKGKGKQKHLLYNFGAVGENIKWGKGKGDGRIIRRRKSRFKKMGWGRISSCRRLNTPLFRISRAASNYSF